MLLMLCFVGSVIAAGAQMERATTGDHWVGTWGTATTREEFHAL